MTSQMRHSIGLDIGGSKIAGVLINENGHISKQYIRPTEAYKSREEILENVLEVIYMLKTEDIVGIGLGAPGFFDEEGRLIYIPNVHNLHKTNLKKEIESRMKTKVFLANDAKCFAIAENRLGSGKGTKNMIGIVIGTGVGSGIIIDGKIYLGKNGGAGEIGHTKIMTDKGLIDSEKLIAGPAFLKRYSELSKKKALSVSQIAKSNEHYKKTYHEFVKNTSVLFSNMINTLNPEKIVVGGGMSHIDFFKDVEREMRRLAIPELGRNCRVVKSKLGTYSGAIGAGLLALEHF